MGFLFASPRLDAFLLHTPCVQSADGDDYISRMHNKPQSMPQRIDCLPFSRPPSPPLAASILYGNATATMASYFHLLLSSLWQQQRRRIQILAAPLTCSPRMIYAAMQRRFATATVAVAKVCGICEKLSDISEFVGSHRKATSAADSSLRILSASTSGSASTSTSAWTLSAALNQCPNRFSERFPKLQ